MPWLTLGHFNLYFMNKELTIQRLEKSIAYWDKLPESKFHFNQFILERDDNMCPTVCCLAGWLPNIDSEYWSYKYDSTTIVERNGIYRLNESSIANYYGINIKLTEAIFYPEKQSDEFGTQKILEIDASLTDVLDNVKEILKQIKDGDLDEYLI